MYEDEDITNEMFLYSSFLKDSLISILIIYIVIEVHFCIYSILIYLEDIKFNTYIIHYCSFIKLQMNVLRFFTWNFYYLIVNILVNLILIFFVESCH